MGPTAVALGTLISDDPKFILLALLPLFIAGAVLLTRVSEPQVLRD
jgi:hypothetical protein